MGYFDLGLVTFLGIGLELLGRIYWVGFGVSYYWIFLIQKLSKGGLARNYFTKIIQTNTFGLKLIIFLARDLG